MGKTSLLHKVVNNYMEEQEDMGSSIVSITQEMMKHSIKTESNENINVTFVSCFA